MSEGQQNMQYYEDEIDLKELIMILWKQKNMIISIILVGAILVGLVSSFLLAPVYNTKLNILINMPEIYNTKYGEYTLPITSNEQYLSFVTSNDVLANTIKDMGYNTENVTIDGLKSRITLENSKAQSGTTQNLYDITVSASTSDESLKLAETLYANYIEFMDIMTKERAVSYYYNDFNVKIKTLNAELKTNEAALKSNELLLADTSQTINQEDAIKELQEKLNSNGEYVIIENMINPNYSEIEKNIILNKQDINKIETQISDINGYLKELELEKTAIKTYYENGQTTTYDSVIVGAIETHISLSSSPVAPTHKSSPNTTMNILIGAVIGAMIGVMVTLVKEYWFNNKKEF